MSTVQMILKKMAGRKKSKAGLLGVHDGSPLSPGGSQAGSSPFPFSLRLSSPLVFLPGGDDWAIGGASSPGLFRRRAPTRCARPFSSSLPSLLCETEHPQTLT